MSDSDDGAIDLAVLLSKWMPNSRNGWGWEEEEADILARYCLCCGERGHYQQQLEEWIAREGLTEGICLGENGRVWDGHHRIVAARRLGIRTVPLESRAEADARWVRDHGYVSWEERLKGDDVVSRVLSEGEAE